MCCCFTRPLGRGSQVPKLLFHPAGGPWVAGPEDAGVLTREQMEAVLLHPYTGLRSPSDQHPRVLARPDCLPPLIRWSPLNFMLKQVSHMSEAGMVTELQALARALVLRLRPQYLHLTPGSFHE